MQNPVNFKNMTAVQIKNVLEEIISNKNLVNFYYSSNNSTDNSLLEILPIGVTYASNSGDMQILGLKIVDGEFQMRRYNLSRISRFSVAIRNEPAYVYEDWKNAHLRYTNYFPQEFAGGHAFIEIDWDEWRAKMRVMNSTVASTYSSASNDLTGKAMFFSLPSNPDVHFINLPHAKYHLNKKSIVKVDFVFEKETLSSFNNVCVQAQLTMSDISVGDVVGINAPNGSDWDKITVTVVAKDEASQEVTIMGVDKNREIYVFSLPVEYVKPKDAPANVVAQTDNSTQTNSWGVPVKKVNSQAWD